jgi:serine protease Do
MRYRSSRIATPCLGVFAWLAGCYVASEDCNAAEGERRVAAVQPAGTEVPVGVIQAQQQRIEAMRKAATATVSIFGLEGDGGGSGVIITPDGYALTNYHVSSACGDHMRCGLNDGRVYDAVIVGVDATGDVSLIKLLGRDDFPTAPLADSDTVRVGQWVFASGNPFVLATNLQPTVTMGIVSGTQRYQYPAGTLLEYADCIQTDAAINPGNSGGPLFNLASEVIGINGRCSFEKRGRVNVGVGYAITANQIKHFMGMLRSGRLVDHATLGATVSTDDSGKVLISNILSTSDAYRRGLRYGDELLSFADRPVTTTNDFKNILGTLPKDWRVPLTFRRSGKTQTTLVRLAGVHTEKQLIDLVDAELGKNAPDPKKSRKKPSEDDPAKEAEGSKNKQDKDKADAKEEVSDEERSLAEGEPNKELVKSMLASRPGFANYYFNELNRDAVWGRVQTLGDFTKLKERWILSGKLAGEPTNVKIEIDSISGSIQLGSRTLELTYADALSDTISKRREGGLLVALRAWQQLLRVGPKQIGETIYLGTAPVYATASMVLAEQPRMHVLQSAWYDTQARFSVPDDSGQIRCIEVFGDASEDPVEVYFDEYREIDGRQWPGRIRLQYGTEPALFLELNSLSFAAENKPQ